MYFDRVPDHIITYKTSLFIILKQVIIDGFQFLKLNDNI